MDNANSPLAFSIEPFHDRVWWSVIWLDLNWQIHRIIYILEISGDIISSLNSNGLEFIGSDNFSLDPNFVSTSNLDLQAGSAAIDQTTEHPVYQEFEDLYGLDIRYDFLGRPRPADSANWDIGAYERQN